MTRLLQSGLMVLLLVLGADRLRGEEVDRYTQAANRLVELMNAGDYKGLQGMFSQEMSQTLPLDKSSEVFQGLTRDLGKLQKLGTPRRVSPAWVFPAQFERGNLDLQIYLEGEKIAGLFFKPHVDAKPAPERNRTALALPFRGKWLVAWGGDTRQVNQHHDVPNQRFALDLLGLGEDGKTHRGAGEKNEDYYCFGREILAPAEGTVTEVIEGVRDNQPGSMNPYSGVGNCVIIQHRADEFSVLAHFQQGSLKVKAGEKVKRGQLLGRCGNSGNSSEPHLHYHLQHSPILQDGLGIKPLFEQVELSKDGKAETKAGYSPVKGDVLVAP